VPTDMTDEAAVAELARRAVERFGRIDVWVNNAGVAACRQGEPVAVADLGADPRWIRLAAVVSQAGTGSAGKAWHDRPRLG